MENTPYSFNELNEASNVYDIICKDKNHIISELHLSLKDEVKCSSIIEHIEANILKTVRDNKCALIPTIAKISKPANVIITQKNFDKLRTARKNLSKEEYKDYVRNMVNEGKKELKTKATHKTYVNSFKKKLFPKYLKIQNKFGEVYAHAWLLTRTHYSVIEFDPELELAYAETYNRESDNY